MDDDEWVDIDDWYGDLPKWSRWWKYGWAAEARRNLRLSLKRNNLYELRHYRRFMYKLRKKYGRHDPYSDPRISG